CRWIFTTTIYVVVIYRSCYEKNWKFSRFMLTGFFISGAQAHDEGFALSSAIWSTRDINVCWESYSTSTQEQRNWIRSAIADSWQKHSRVSFNNWGLCSSNSTGVRIQVA